jgi:large subunit ribosomal protein L9
MDIAEALQAKGYEIDRRKITLKEAIKETGEYTVPIKLHREVTLNVPVIVTAEGGATVAAAVPATDEAAGGGTAESNAPDTATETNEA